MKLIGKNIIGKTIIVEAEGRTAIAKAKRVYAAAGIALTSYDKAIRREADRPVNRPDDEPEYRF